MLGRGVDLWWVLVSLTLAYLTLPPAVADARYEAAAYFFLHLQAAVLFAIRRPPVIRASPRWQSIVPIASLLYGYAFDISGERPAGQAIVLAGCVVCFVSTWTLGRSYAVLPALRRLAVSGPYRIVRHPIYASYVIMDVGMVVNTPTPRNVSLALLGAVLFLWRIEMEEEVLAREPASEIYRRHVPFKLFPGVY